MSNPKTSLSEKIRKIPLWGKLLIILGIIVIVSTPIVIYFSKNSFFNRMNTYMVEMRDGVKLATDIYLPSGEGPFPFVVFRTPYGKSEALDNVGFFLEHDVGILAQDHRGCHDSEGEYTAFGADGQDALNTVNWLKEQSWFNGKYATFGASARGITQYMQVPYLDDVACQAIYVATPYLFSQAMYQGGAPRKMLVENWLESIGHGYYYSEYLFDHPLITSPYAQEHQIDPWEWGNVTWPSLHKGGWYDCFSQGILDGFSGYQYQGGTGGANNAKLIIGPWTHNLNQNPEGELVYPNNIYDDPSTDKIFDAMFAEQLLGETEYGDYRTMSNVTYYVMGDTTTQSTQWNRWATSPVWPVLYSNVSYYLEPDNSLSTSLPNTSKNISYIFNPMNPLPTLGGANLMDDNRGPYNQNHVEVGREDVVQFEYPVNDPILITGRIWAHLFVSSNCTDTDFTVKLMDVYPDGRSMLVCDGIIRMRYREGQDKELLMAGTKQTVYEAYVDLWSTSYVFNSGHKIRISISSSNYPRFDVNPNTGTEVQPVTEQTPYVLANNSIIVSPNYPSEIILPVPLSQPTFVDDASFRKKSQEENNEPYFNEERLMEGSSLLNRLLTERILFSFKRIKIRTINQSL
ncbi:MAG: CocE/NonD family hydrolase [Candidatus Heimdallarchaeota archaeon]|nr:CocE/NonD family hydrolase [Candidatus Heimdallarchaeota archaeon]